VSPPRATLRPGTALAPGYAVLGHVHRGKTLDVYEVWSDERACQCIAKLVRPDRLHETKPRRRLYREGRLLERMTHPHIVRAYEVLERPQPVVVLETLQGATLSYLIEDEYERRGLPLADVAALGLHLCSALAYLHRKCLLHLDLKPSNIVSELGRAKVIDLSIARRPGRGSKGAGTRVYMAPEQARGGMLSEATDVWGLGAVLYEAAAGKRPFAQQRMKYPQLTRRAPSVGAVRRLPRELVAVIDACLEPPPRARPTVSELVPVLEALAP
jgi:serine/threonine protein kinase